MAARGSDLWVHVTLCLNTSEYIAALKMAALEAQRICGARWLSETCQAHESFTNFTPLDWKFLMLRWTVCYVRFVFYVCYFCICVFLPYQTLGIVQIWLLRWVCSGTHQGGAETRPRETMPWDTLAENECWNQCLLLRFEATGDKP